MLGSMNYGIGLWTSARCVVWSLVMVRLAIELKYSIDTYRYASYINVDIFFYF